MLRGQELPESDEAWLLEIITKAETMAFPENFSLIIRGLKMSKYICKECFGFTDNIPYYPRWATGKDLCRCK